MAEVRRPTSLSRGQRAAVGVSVALGLGLAGYGVAGSYQTVSALAKHRGVPLAPLVPVGIDGGLIGVVVLDLVLSWIGQPIGWLRQFVRILTVGTVAANAAAGWPDLVSAGLHVAAPLMLLAMVEAGRIVLLRRIKSADGRTRDPIPVARWVLAPWPTWLMWRRMVLWRIGSFRGRFGGRARATPCDRAVEGQLWSALEAARAGGTGMDAASRHVHGRRCRPRPRTRGRDGHGRRTCPTGCRRYEMGNGHVRRNSARRERTYRWTR
jgi:hypothetical protein